MLGDEPGTNYRGIYMTALVTFRNPRTIKEERVEAIPCARITVDDEHITIMRDRIPDWRLPLSRYRLCGTSY